jgi:hypothetical protein
MLTDDLHQTLFEVPAGQAQPQSAAEMAEDMRNTGDAMAESASESMADDDFTSSILDAMSADETLLQISDEPEDQTNLFLFEEFMMPSKTKRAVSDHASFEPRDETDLLIETINGLDIGWKADTCKLSKGHANRGAHCDLEKTTLAQEKSSNVLNAQGSKPFGQGEDFPAALAEA